MDFFPEMQAGTVKAYTVRLIAVIVTKTLLGLMFATTLFAYVVA